MKEMKNIALMTLGELMEQDDWIDEYADQFIARATEQQRKFIPLAYKILDRVDMGLIQEYTDDIHLEKLTNALDEVSKSDPDFIVRLTEAESDEKYIELKPYIPDNEVLKEYVESGNLRITD